MTAKNRRCTLGSQPKCLYDVFATPVSWQGLRRYLGRTRAVSPEEAVAHMIFRLYGKVPRNSLGLIFEAEKVETRLSGRRPIGATKHWSSQQLFLPGCLPYDASLEDPRR